MGSSAAKGIGSIEARRPSPMLRRPTLAVAPASLADASAVVEVIAEAFLNDPTWSWAVPDPAARRRWWTYWIDGALRYPWTLKTGGFETVSVWIPPSGTELSDDGEERLPGLLQELVGSRAAEVAELLSRFDRSTPAQRTALLSESLRHQGRASRARPRHGAAQGEPRAHRRGGHAHLSRIRAIRATTTATKRWLRARCCSRAPGRRPCRDGDVAEVPMSGRIEVTSALSPDRHTGESRYPALSHCSALDSGFRRNDEPWKRKSELTRPTQAGAFRVALMPRCSRSSIG